MKTQSVILTVGLVMILSLWVFAFTFVNEPTKPLDFEREWKITIIDHNEAIFTSKGDTVMISLETTYGLQDINPVVFMNK